VAVLVPNTRDVVAATNRTRSATGLSDWGDVVRDLVTTLECGWEDAEAAIHVAMHEGDVRELASGLLKVPDAARGRAGGGA